MNTRKTIYDKLFTEKVELAKHEVNLGLADDIKKQTNVLNTLIKNHGFVIQKKVVEDYNVKVNDIYKVAYNKLEENYNLISKQANLLKPIMERFIISAKKKNRLLPRTKSKCRKKIKLKETGIQ